MFFTGLGRSVLGENVPSVWVPPSAYGLGWYSRPRAQFLPIRTSQPVNNIYVLHGGLENLIYARIFTCSSKSSRIILSVYAVESGVSICLFFFPFFGYPCFIST